MRAGKPGMLALWLTLAVGCGDDPEAASAKGPAAPTKSTPDNPSDEGPKGAQPAAPPGAAPAPPPGAPPPGGGAPAAPPGLAPPPSVSKDKLLAEIRKRPFRPEDYNPSPPTNTDPFHNNLDRFIIAPPTPTGITNALLPKYNLEELKLSAIIIGSGDGTTARAMFIDPSGVGTVVRRGDRVGKTGAMVQRVLSDRVLFEFTEDAGQGKKRTVVRAIELHPAEPKEGQGGGGPPPTMPR